MQIKDWLTQTNPDGARTTSQSSAQFSHAPLLGGYDEPRTLSYQITLFGPIFSALSHDDSCGNQFPPDAAFCTDLAKVTAASLFESNRQVVERFIASN